MKKIVVSVLCVLMLTVVLSPIFAGGTKEGSKEKHAFVFKNTGNPYGEKQMEGFKEIIEEHGFEAILRAPEQPTAEAQIQIIEQLIAQKVKSICVTANDYDALQPVLIKAMNMGIKVTAADSNVNPASRMTFINQADPELIGRTLVRAAYDLSGGSGDFAILSATSQASNQNLWIEWMKKELTENSAKYRNLKLVKVAYGDDLRDKSVSETEALLRTFPQLKCIVAPTTVGIAAAAKVISDKGLTGRVAITGLGLPSEMAEYIDNGSCPYMYLWNPIDVGKLAGYISIVLSSGKITGKVGENFSAGKLGNFSVTKASDGGTEVLLGSPFKFDKANINEWKTVY
ncbi:rhamnose ABC transporter substrate-binding protein [Treponema sp. OMZ 840]|uniref:rhamnose ABC transporter substrate-binding protein n=1 Tax=Treponema sp. OMZ 840 TaxID=244313 RepID=UPI003D8F10BD